jgi:ABC-type antimicrobial peptide transport system permease subunit
VLALSVGIGLNAGVFTILDSLFLETPTNIDPASFVQIYPRYQGWYIGRAQDSSFNAADYEAIRTQARSLSDVAAWQKIGTTLDDVRHQGDSLVVVGIAADARSERFSILDGPRLYTLQDSQSHDGQLFVRFSGDAKPVAASIEAIIQTLDVSQVGIPSTIWDFLAANATAMRSLAKIILFMAGIAVVLAITGVYGVLTFAISQRTREFGIQMMLGATRQSIFKSVMKRGLRQIAVGILMGLAMALATAWAFTRIMKKGWMHIDAFDVSVYGISMVILLVVSLSAMFLPALRAMQVDPIQALRNE